MTTARRKLRTWSRKHFTRDWIIRAVGIGGVIFETVTNHAERPTLLILLGAMIGLPQFLHHDEAAPPPKPDPSKTIEEGDTK